MISNVIRAELDLPIDRVTFWTDLLTVLQHIKNETRFHRFVATLEFGTQLMMDCKDGPLRHFSPDVDGG